MEKDGKKVLYISYDGMTDTLGQSQVIPYLEGLAKLGYDITILSAEKKEKLAAYGKVVGEMLKRSGIQWEHIAFSSAVPVLSKAYDRSRLLGRAVALQKEHGYEIIHCRSYVAAEAGMELKNKFGCRFLFDMRGFWVDERVEGKIWNLKNPAFKIAYERYKRLETKMIGSADQIVCLTKKAKTLLMEKWDAREEKISVIPCAADLELFSPLGENAKKEARKRIGLNADDFIIGYLGSFGTWYMLKEMLEFFAALKKKKKNVRFLFLSPGHEDDVLDAAGRLQIPVNDIIVRFMPRKDIPSVFGAVDAGIFFIRPTPSKKASSPVKFGEMLAMGLPVICNRGIGDVDEIMEKYHCGWLIDDLSANGMARAAETMMAEALPSGESMRQVAAQHFDHRQSIRDYAEVYSRMNKV